MGSKVSKLRKNITNKSIDNIPLFPSHITLTQALALDVTDNIDHRQQDGYFHFAIIIAKKGTNLKIHYHGLSKMYDIWSDFKEEIHRFAEAGSISKRPSHRLTELEKDDFIDINPIHRHLGWKCGKIITLDKTSGQIMVSYKYNGKEYVYWTHLDNNHEINEYKYNINHVIIDGFIKNCILFNKYNININKIVAMFCGNYLYKAIISAPSINIESMFSDSMILNIMNNDKDSNGYRIIYKSKRMDNLNITDIDLNSKQIHYKIEGLDAGTSYLMSVESRNNDNIHITSSKINFKTNYNIKQTNDLIIYGDIRRYEKQHKLFMFIPIDIYKMVSIFCGGIEPILISVATINIKAIYMTSIQLEITINNDDNNIIAFKQNIIALDTNTMLENTENIIEKKMWKKYYIITGLQAGTYYKISICSINKHKIQGRSSNIIEFRTAYDWKFDVITNGYNHCIKNNGKKFELIQDPKNDYVTATYSKGFNKGIHLFKIRCIGDCRNNAFSIVADDIYKSNGWIWDHNNKHYYFDSSFGDIYYGFSNKLRQAQQWKLGDSIGMILDCNQWTLCYEIKGNSYKINIEKNKTYYPCITAHYKGSAFIIL